MEDHEDKILAENQRLREALKEAMILVNLAAAYRSSRKPDSQLAVIDVLMNKRSIDEVSKEYGYRWHTVQEWVKRTENNLRMLAQRARMMRTRSTKQSTCSSEPAPARSSAASG